MAAAAHFPCTDQTRLWFELFESLYWGEAAAATPQLLREPLGMDLSARWTQIEAVNLWWLWNLPPVTQWSRRTERSCDLQMAWLGRYTYISNFPTCWDFFLAKLPSNSLPCVFRAHLGLFIFWAPEKTKVYSMTFIPMFSHVGVLCTIPSFLLNHHKKVIWVSFGLIWSVKRGE